LFLFVQNQKCLQDQSAITNKSWENYYKAPKSKAKNDMGNMAILLF
jgi:hypothetical protein